MDYQGQINDVTAYWSNRPCNSRHSLACIDTDPLRYSQEVTERKFKVEPHLVHAARFDRCWHGQRVLDLGCGIGTESLAFARAGALVVGLDLSRASVDIAIKRASAEGLLGRAMFYLVDMEQEPLPDEWGTYDLVWAWGSVHHTPRPDLAVQNAVTYLKPGGELRLMVYHRLSTKALRLWVRAGCPRDFDGAVARGSEAQPGCPITHTYTRRSVRRLVEGAGLAVESIEVDHIFPWDGDAYGRHVYVEALPWRWMPWKLYRRLKRIMGWHLMVVARRGE